MHENETQIRKDTLQHFPSIEQEAKRLFRQLWETPELPAMETMAAAAISEWLRKEGFDVEEGICGLNTAFKAKWSQKKGPRIVFLAEYDSLPGTDNDAVPYRQKTGRAQGHACGHNQIGPANSAAAIAAKRTLEKLDIAGEIIVVGCPAEEIVWGKVALLKLGAFDDADIILTSHGDYQNGVINRPCMSIFSTEAVFSGVSGHSGAPPRGNALDAAELAVQSIERLRAHSFSNTGVEHVVRFGGHMPAVTPDEARLWIITRHVDYSAAQEVYDLIVDVCQHAAKMTETKFREQFIVATRGYMPNDTVANVMMGPMLHLGPPAWSETDLAWMKELCKACDKTDNFILDDKVELYSDGHDNYGQDDGEVSWHVPLGRVNWALPRQVPLHNWAFTALSGHHSSFAGPIFASKVLALSAVELLLNPDQIEKAKLELDKRRQELSLSPPRIGAMQTLRSSPESFWEGTWDETTEFNT